MHLVKHLKGHSGAVVSLYAQSDKHYVVKDNYGKAMESTAILRSLPFPTPEVYEVSDTRIVMEYLNGVDMATYLESASEDDINRLIDFISDYIKHCLNNSTEYDFTKEINNKLNVLEEYISLNWININPKLPQSIIHGDLTLENIMYANGQFYFIDANPTELNSIYFDVNKLRQDIDSLWFVRNRKNKLHFKIICTKIKNELYKRFPELFDDNGAVFMLARILPYTKDIETQDFLIEEILKYGDNCTVRR